SGVYLVGCLSWVELFMSQASSSDRELLDLPRLLEDFEEAWQSGVPPSIEQFLRPVADAAARRELLVKLIRIDLDNRWRRVLTAQSSSSRVSFDRLHLADYVQRFPELGPLEKLPPELIADEYWVRRCWGDHPGHEEYLARFGQQVDNLRQALAQIDAESAWRP